MAILPSLLHPTPAPLPTGDGPFPDAEAVVSSPPVVLPLHRLLSRLDGVIRSATADIDPGGVWITAEVTKVTERKGAWFAELTDSMPGKSSSACLSVRIGPQAIENLSLHAGIAVTPDLLKGQTVTLRVGLRLHPRYGLSAQVLEIDPRMMPSLRAAAADRLRQEVREGGLHDLQRALPIPGDIVHLALVCPDASAARGDVDAVLAPLVERHLIVLDMHIVRFEGPEAAGDLVTALDTIAQQTWRPRAEAVLIVRGGGSAAGMADIETLAVAKTIAAMPMPVVLGIGHAPDNGILSGIAWRSCITPTGAATAVRDLIAGAATEARDNAAAIAALCRERIGMQEAACRTVADAIRRAGFRAFGEQAKQLAVRERGIDTAAARLDERLLALDADIGRMIAGLHAQVSGATGVFARHLDDLDRMARTVRERSTVLMMTAERDIALRAAQLAQAQLSQAQLSETRLSLAQPLVPPVSPVAEAAPVIVRDGGGAVVTSAGRARGRPLTLSFHDGDVPVVPHHTALTPPVTDVPAS